MNSTNLGGKVMIVFCFFCNLLTALPEKVIILGNNLSLIHAFCTCGSAVFPIASLEKALTKHLYQNDGLHFNTRISVFLLSVCMCNSRQGMINRQYGDLLEQNGLKGADLVHLSLVENRVDLKSSSWLNSLLKEYACFHCETQCKLRIH